MFQDTAQEKLKSIDVILVKSEKPNKFFLNIEKTRTFHSIFRTLVKNEKEINGLLEISSELQYFYKKLFLPIIYLFQTKCSFSFRRFVSAKTLGRTSYKI